MIHGPGSTIHPDHPSSKLTFWDKFTWINGIKPGIDWKRESPSYPSIDALREANGTSMEQLVQG